jgi:hypothetical protein
MAALGPLLGVTALALGLAVVGSTLGSPLIVGVALFSALLAAAPLVASILFESTHPVDHAHE